MLFFRNILLKILYSNFSHFISDKYYLQLLTFSRTGKKLNLSSPLTYSDKIQWLKLYDRKPIYSIMVDKYDAKKYVSNIIGEEYVIPTIGIFDSFDDINFDSLPNQFVIKCTHDSGGLFIVKDKANLDIEEVRKKINRCFKTNYFYHSREWPYKNVKPRIIIEKYMVDNSSASMRDYKFFCFNGLPKLMYLSEGLENHKTARMSFFDMNFNLLECSRQDYKPLDYFPEKPLTFDLMKKFASILSKDIPHLRVDFYEINGHLYFGELTFSTCSGYIPFTDEKWNRILGDYISLPNDIFRS